MAIPRMKALFLCLLVVADLAFISGLLSATGIDSNMLHEVIAPISVPVPETGASDIDVAMTRLRFRAEGSTTPPNTSISEIRVTLTSDATFAASGITAIKVYYDAGGGTYDNGGSGGDQRVDTLGPYDFLSGTTVDIQLDPTKVNFNASGWKFLYIVYQINSTADTARQIGCRIDQFEYGAANVGTGSYITPSSTPPLPALALYTGRTGTLNQNVDNYEVTLAATGIAPAEASEKDEGVPVLKMVFDVADDQVTADIDSIKLHRIGSGSDYNDLSAITIFNDLGSTSGTFDDNDQPIAGASGTLGTDDYVTLNPTANLQVSSALAERERTYYVVVNVAEGSYAPGGKTIGLQIENPSTDVVFIDTIDDDLSTVQTEYAVVLQGYPYTQKGYFDTSAPTYEAPTPTTGNTFTILQYIPFLVTGITPSDLAPGIARNAVVKAEFSRDVDTGTLDNSSFYLHDSLGVNVTLLKPIEYDSGTKIATLTPASLLKWGEKYTATVTTAVKDTKGNNLEAQKDWSFTTVVAVYPTVLDTSPTDDQPEVPRANNITATFSKSMNSGTINTSTFLLKDHLGNPVSGTVGYNDLYYRATFNPDSTLLWNETYTATLTTDVKSADDLNLQAQYEWSFTTMVQVYPTVVNTQPAANEPDVSRSIQVTATFDQDINEADAESSFSLMQGATPIPGTADYVPGTRTLTFSLSSPPLLYFTQYTAKIDMTKIHWTYDGEELYMQADKEWSFTTITSAPPRVLSVTPAEDATGVAIASTIQVVFSKPVDATTLAANITVQAGGVLLSGTVSPSTGYTYDATFTPTSPLDYLKIYAVTIGAGITDSEGTALSAPKTWSFTTFGFTKATIVNNRLVPGVNSECLIFVPQAGASKRVSVQVFTTTGRLVRTFYKNAAFSSVLVPIRWDGTNDRGKPLGPGMYFVQIVVAGVKQVLKVLIVR